MLDGRDFASVHMWLLPYLGERVVVNGGLFRGFVFRWVVVL